MRITELRRRLRDVARTRAALRDAESRQGRTKIAHRFIGGDRADKGEKSRQGRKKIV